MPNPRLAFRYAKALIDLSIEKGQPEQVYKDVLFLKTVFSKSKELVSFLHNPVINFEQKLSFVKAIETENTGEITKSFNRFLIRKGRENYLPEIVDSFIDQYKAHKGISTVTLITAVPVSDEIKNFFIQKIKMSGRMQEVELLTVVQEDIIGGFILEGNGRRIDASVAYDLMKVKNRFLTNEFIYRFR